MRFQEKPHTGCFIHPVALHIRTKIVNLCPSYSTSPYVCPANAGISRDSWHKRRKTGGHRVPLRKKRKFELGRPAAMTKIGPKRIHSVRCMGGSTKFRALRLETGNFSWGSEAITRKSRILGVVYNSSNNELVRTNTLVKNCIIQIDATPFRQVRVCSMRSRFCM